MLKHKTINLQFPLHNELAGVGSEPGNALMGLLALISWDITPGSRCQLVEQKVAKLDYILYARKSTVFSQSPPPTLALLRPYPIPYTVPTI